MKRMLILFLTLSLCMSLCACGGNTPTNGAETIPATEEAAPLEITAVGQEVDFGSYYYRANKEEEAITWIVLDIQEDKALLISECALTAKKNEAIEAGWSTSDMAPYMNMLASDMFTEEEKAQILCEEIDGQTSGYLFLLDSAEVETYMPGENNKLRLAMATGYAIDEGVEVHEGYTSGAYCNWVLRDGSWVGGQRGNSGEIKNATKPKYDYGIRPAMWISLP